MSSEGEPNGPWCSTGAKALNAPGEFDQVDLPPVSIVRLHDVGTEAKSAREVRISRAFALVFVVGVKDVRDHRPGRWCFIRMAHIRLDIPTVRLMHDLRKGAICL